MKFKVGDRVKYIGRLFNNLLKKEGIITGINYKDYEVKFENEIYNCLESSLELVSPTLLALPKDTTNPSVFPSIPQELIRFQEHKKSIEDKMGKLKQEILDKEHEYEVLDEELRVIQKLEKVMEGE